MAAMRGAAGGPALPPAFEALIRWALPAVRAPGRARAFRGRRQRARMLACPASWGEGGHSRAGCPGPAGIAGPGTVAPAQGRCAPGTAHGQAPLAPFPSAAADPSWSPRRTIGIGTTITRRVLGRATLADHRRAAAQPAPGRHPGHGTLLHAGALVVDPQAIHVSEPGVGLRIRPAGLRTFSPSGPGRSCTRQGRRSRS